MRSAYTLGLSFLPLVTTRKKPPLVDESMWFGLRRMLLIGCDSTPDVYDKSNGFSITREDVIDMIERMDSTSGRRYGGGLVAQPWNDPNMLQPNHLLDDDKSHSAYFIDVGKIKKAKRSKAKQRMAKQSRKHNRR